jgi:hypothetical protein
MRAKYEPTVVPMIMRRFYKFSLFASAAKLISVFMIVVISFVTPLFGEDFLDRSCVPEFANSEVFGTLNGQLFEIGKHGYLTGFDVLMSRSSRIVEPLGFVSWEIRKTIGTQPLLDSTGLLASGSFAFVSLSENFGLYHIELPGEGLPVIADQLLIMLLECHTNRYRWFGGGTACHWNCLALNKQTGLLDPLSFTLGHRTFVQPELKPPVPPMVACPRPIALECTNVANATLEATVQDPHANALEVTWEVDGSPAQTNLIRAGLFAASTVTLSRTFSSGDHEVLISASNGKTAPTTCLTSIHVGDSTPPMISGISADPSFIWPPDHRMVPVHITVVVDDNCGAAACRIASVWTNQINPPGSKPDWEIDGLGVNLRADRQGSASDRIYRIIVECEDIIGNKSQQEVDITVPHDNKNNR